MMHWDWFAAIVVGLAIYGFMTIKEKLDRIVKLLESANQTHATAAERISTKLDGVIHHTSLIRDKLPGRPSDDF